MERVRSRKDESPALAAGDGPLRDQARPSPGRASLAPIATEPGFRATEPGLGVADACVAPTRDSRRSEAGLEAGARNVSGGQLGAGASTGEKVAELRPPGNCEDAAWAGLLAPGALHAEPAFAAS
jgi:hypothetical protein